MDWRNAPDEVKKIQDEVRKLEIKPVESYAAIHLQRHGLEFAKQAIRACLKTE
jgi:hypothetical protein